MKKKQKYVGSSPMKMPIDPMTASMLVSAGVGLINTIAGGKAKRRARRAII